MTFIERSYLHFKKKTGEDLSEQIQDFKSQMEDHKQEI